MCVAGGLLVESEELSEFTQREVTLHILLLVHDTAAQGFLMSLPLQDLLLDRPRLSTQMSQAWKLCDLLPWHVENEGLNVTVLSVATVKT